MHVAWNGEGYTEKVTSQPLDGMIRAPRDRQPEASTQTQAPAGRAPVLVLGIGNLLMQDEGVGVRVVQELARRSLPEGVELCDGATAGLDLLDILAGRRKVIVIDAVRCDAQPGTILRIEIDDLTFKPGVAISLHEFGLIATLRAGRLLGCLPEHMVLYGVRPAHLDMGLELSSQVADVIPRLIEQVIAEVTETRDRLST